MTTTIIYRLGINEGRIARECHIAHYNAATEINRMRYHANVSKASIGRLIRTIDNIPEHNRDIRPIMNGWMVVKYA